MSITSRISSMEEHVTNAYNGLQGLGADLTGIDKNIDNIASVLDDIYDDLPKVTGSGTSITLDDTRKGRLESTLSGNTSQFTTTGKNKYPTDFLPKTEYGITISKNANGDIVLNGTPNYNEGYKTFYTGDVITVEAGTYTLSVANKISGIGCVVGGFNGGCNLTLNDTVTSKSAYADTPQNVNPAINIRYDVGTLNNFIINPQMEKSSSATTYEPFTNGASPNPDYPQDIHVVSGDNSIEVCGKNLFDKDNIFVGYLKEDATLSTDTAYRTSAFMPIRPNTTYYKTSTGSPRTKYFDINKVPLNTTTYWDVPTGGSAGTFTTPNNAYYLRFSFPFSGSSAIDVSTIMVKEGTDTTYEPYIGNTYPINLGVENLLQNNLTSGTINGITYVVNEDKSVTLSGTATSITWLILNNNLPLEAGTYTMSQGYTGNDVRMYSTGLGTYTVDGVKTITKTTSISGDVSINIPNGTAITTPITIKPMIEKSSKAHSYTPYGTTPIELAEISTYNDEIFRTSGKNLCNGINQGVYLNNDVNRCGVTSGDSGLYIPVNGGQYTISTLVTQTRYRVACSNDLPPSVGSTIAYNGKNKDNTSNSITINTTGYNYLIVNATDLSAIQIEKGTTATEYNPYGTGEWYYKEATKKLVLDGTQNITLANGTPRRFNATYTTLGITNIKEGSSAEDTTLNYRKCDHFIYSAGLTNWGRYYLYNSWLVLLDNNSVLADAEALKTWLSNNNTTIRYALATPTYTKITSSNYPTLYSQLEAIYNAQGYDNQTNISQTNNDLPFKITASALKEWSV